MPQYPFVTVDVFTTRRFGGNPLAVITDARGLSTESMQAIASEFGYSETTFVLPPEDTAHTAKVRIFTPVTEVPFAGHPNVGTAFVLANTGNAFGSNEHGKLFFEEAAGLVEIDLDYQDGHLATASLRAPQNLSIGEDVDVDLVARCVNLEPEDIVTSNHAPRFASVGLKFVIAEVTDLLALGRAYPNKQSFLDGVERYAHEQFDFSVFVYVRMDGDTHVRARMFAPLDNVDEDPATGSASGALAGLLAHLRAEADTDLEILIEQGVEMGRASEIRARAVKTEGRVEAVYIAGTSIEVMSGMIEA